MKTTLSAKISALFILLSAVVACSRTSDTETEGGIRTIHVDVDVAPAPVKTSEILKDVRIVPLETNDSCLLDEIRTIKMLNGYIYISAGGTLYKFDKRGRFLTSMKRQGNGPGEYVSLWDFDVDKQGNVYVFCQRTCRVYVYDGRGDFKKKIDLKGNPKCILVRDDGSILVDHGNDYSRVYDKSLVVVRDSVVEGFGHLAVDTFICKYADALIMLSSFRRDGDRVIMYKSRNDTVYTVTDKGIEYLARMDYSGRNVPIEFYHQQYDNIMVYGDALCHTNYIENGTAYSEGETYVFNTVLSAKKDEKWGFTFENKQAIVNKQTKETKIASEIVDDQSLYGMKVLPVYPLSGSTFAWSIDVADILSHAETLSETERGELLKRINYQDEDQNPVLYIGTFK